MDMNCWSWARYHETVVDVGFVQRSALHTDPDSSEARALQPSVEQSFLERTYRTDLPPEAVPVLTALRTLQRAWEQMALVISEYGGI